MVWVSQFLAAGLAVKEVVIPSAYAVERSSGDEPLRGGVGEGQSMGHIQQLGQTAEAVLEHAMTDRPQSPGVNIRNDLYVSVSHLVFLQKSIHRLVQSRMMQNNLKPRYPNVQPRGRRQQVG